MTGLRCAVVVLVALGAFAQSPRDQARIDYEAAKRAFEKGDHEFALAQLEEVMKVLGEQPELLTIAAEASFNLKRLEQARAYVEQAFAAADDKFRSTPMFERLVAVAADLKMAKAAEDKKWKKPVDSLCSLEFFPVSPTYLRRFRDSNGWTSTKSVSKIARNYVEISDAPGPESERRPSTTQYRCDEGGIIPHFQGHSGYEIIATLSPGTAWQQKFSTPEVSSSTRCIASGPERVSVAAGAFDAIRVDCENQGSGALVIRFRVWYASGVGEVKREVDLIRGESTNSSSIELQEWTP